MSGSQKGEPASKSAEHIEHLYLEPGKISSPSEGMLVMRMLDIHMISLRDNFECDPISRERCLHCKVSAERSISRSKFSSLSGIALRCLVV